jgi:hypothetical protein
MLCFIVYVKNVYATLKKSVSDAIDVICVATLCVRVDAVKEI